jgi:hypothetical protein
VVVLGVVCVLLVDCPAGAPAAPAMPAPTPPVASAPTTSPTLIIFVLFIGEPPMLAFSLTQTMLGVTPKRGATRL